MEERIILMNFHSNHSLDGQGLGLTYARLREFEKKSELESPYKKKIKYKLTAYLFKFS